jgi:1,4-dihydroxy-2-naphthoate octaprenyltransferase
MRRSRDDLLRDLRSATEASVSTIAGEYIRSRMMHYAVTDDLIFYLATLKRDPKVIHITYNPSISLMILRKVGDPNKYMDISEFSNWREIEVQGKARIVRDKNEREKALSLLSERSPIVKLLKDTGQDHVLDVIRVEPHVIRYKVVADILQGKPPLVVEFKDRPSSFEEFGLLKQKLRNWYVAIRAPFLVAGVPPVVLGALVALNVIGTIDIWLLLLTLFGVLLSHISVNLLNDYFDHKYRTDVVNTQFIRPFSGGSRVIQMGLLTPLEVLLGGLLSLIIAVGIGLYLSIVSSYLVLLIAVIGLFSILFYNAPPLRLSGKGIGEFVVGLNFGVLVALGSFVVQTKTLTLDPLFPSIPLAILVSLILIINEFPDVYADKETDKKTIVVRLGREKARWLYLSLMATVYIYTIIVSVIGFIPIYGLLSLFTLPLTIYSIKYLFNYYDSPFDMIPSYIATIILYISIGFLIVIAYLVSAITSLNVLVITVSLILTYIIYEYINIKRDLKAFLTIKGVIKTH